MELVAARQSGRAFMHDNSSNVAATELRELSRRVMLEEMDGARLRRYMRGLLEESHTELSAACRIEAARLSRHAGEMTHASLAEALGLRADELDRRTATIAPAWMRVVRSLGIGAGSACFAYGFEEMLDWRGGVAALAVGGWLLLVSLSCGTHPGEGAATAPFATDRESARNQPPLQ